MAAELELQRRPRAGNQQGRSGTVSLVTVNLSLASRAERNWTENQRTMSNLYWMFAVLCGVVGLEVVAWSFAVI